MADSGGGGGGGGDDDGSRSAEEAASGGGDGAVAAAAVASGGGGGGDGAADAAKSSSAAAAAANGGGHGDDDGDVEPVGVVASNKGKADGDDDDDDDDAAAAAAQAGLEDGVPLQLPSTVPDSACKFVLRTFVLTLLTALATALYYLIFGPPGLGYGPLNFLLITSFGGYFAYPLAMAAALFFLLYIFDFSHWTGCWWYFKMALLIFMLLALALGFVLASTIVPGTPIALFVLLFPAYMAAARVAFYRRTPMHRYLYSMAVALLITGTASIGVWIGYIVVSNYFWGPMTKLYFAELAFCGPPDPPIAGQHVDICLQAWILWVAPFLGGLNSFVFGIAALILGHSVRQTERPITIALKVFISLLLLAVVVVWVASSIAGAGIRIAGAVQLFSGVFVAVLCGAIVVTVGVSTLASQMASIPLIQQASQSLVNDWAKAIFVLAIGWALPLYFALSLINAFLRRHMPFGYRIHDADERALWLTKIGSHQYAQMRRWRWSQLLIKVFILSWVYFTLTVGVSKLVTLFLAWLNEAMAALVSSSGDLGLLWVTLIFMLVGITMFLLPPVPGVPVYLAAGIIFGKQAKAPLGDSEVAAVCYACFISFLLKMMAIAMQQKLIGQGMSRFVGVRKMVGVNSLMIRSIRKVLTEPGVFSKAKVAILCGGPDWPTSVLTGILRLSVLRMLAASLPVFFLIVPTAMAGAFLLKVDDNARAADNPWGSIASVTLAIAALTQMMSLLAATYYISETSERHQAELDAMELDEEVAAAERAEARSVEIYLAVTDWQRSLPWHQKVNLVLMACEAALTVYVLQLRAKDCFLPFNVSDPVDRLRGPHYLIVFPLGYIVLALLALPIVHYIVFRIWLCWRKSRVPPDYEVPLDIIAVVEPQKNKTLLPKGILPENTKLNIGLSAKDAKLPAYE